MTKAEQLGLGRVLCMYGAYGSVVSGQCQILISMTKTREDMGCKPWNFPDFPSIRSEKFFT